MPSWNTINRKIEALEQQVKRMRATGSVQNVLAGNCETGLKNLPRMFATAGQIESSFPPGVVPPIPERIDARPDCSSIRRTGDNESGLIQPPKPSQ